MSIFKEGQLTESHIRNRRRRIMRHVLALIAAVLLSGIASAQVSVNIGINIDRQPVWGPTGYDHVEYYYLPDIEVYYNVPQHKYFYQERGRWIGGPSLPSRYRGFDLYSSHKVVVNERDPYRHHEKYRDQYVSYKGRHDQEPIRDSRDSRYFVNPNHPEHNKWAKQQKHGNDDGKGKNNGKGNGRGNKPGRK
jgi:hypothetical protein